MNFEEFNQVLKFRRALHCKCMKMRFVDLLMQEIKSTALRGMPFASIFVLKLFHHSKLKMTFVVDRLWPVLARERKWHSKVCAKISAKFQ